jgi:hypothetical protein
MHVPVPFGAIARRMASAYSYFRTGVAIEGRAWLCDDGHPMIYAGGEWPTAPRHVDVDLKLWNRRGDRVTVLEIARAEIPSYSVQLSASSYPDFKAVTLEPGADRVERYFVLVPKHDPEGRVDAAVRAWLHLEFRPSRGSERWARPRFRCQLELKDSSDRNV